MADRRLLFLQGGYGRPVITWWSSPVPAANAPNIGLSVDHLTSTAPVWSMTNGSRNWWLSVQSCSEENT